MIAVPGHWRVACSSRRLHGSRLLSFWTALSYRNVFVVPVTLDFFISIPAQDARQWKAISPTDASPTEATPPLSGFFCAREMGGQYCATHCNATRCSAVQQHYLTVSQAAELYGVARSTVHRKLKSGRMSSTVRGDGKRVIAMSELIRVIGEPGTVEEKVQQNAPPPDVFNDMLAELQALRSEVAELKTHMMRLPAPEMVSQPDHATPGTKSSDDKPVNLFAAEMAALRARREE